jgi:membrane protein required for colicin V production
VNLDLAVLALLLVFAIWGAFSGALRQILFLSGGVLGYLAARAWAPAVAEGVAASLPRALTRAAAAVLLFFGVQAAVSIAGHLLLRWAGAGRRLWAPLDRALGALLGASWGGLGIWVLLSVLVLLGPVGAGSLRADPGRSDFAAMAREHNLFDTWRSPTSDALKSLLRVARDPRGSARLLADADARRLLEDPRVQALLSDARASGERDSPSVLGSAKALELLSDPDFLERLEQAQHKIRQADPRR